MPVICIEDGRTLTVRLVGEIDHHAAKEIMGLRGARRFIHGFFLSCR